MLKEKWRKKVGGYNLWYRKNQTSGRRKCITFKKVETEVLRGIATFNAIMNRNPDVKPAL